MNQANHFDFAVDLMDKGDYHELRVLLVRFPKLVKERDSSNATLLIRLIDYPGHRPNAHKSARVLLVAGDNKNGTALSGALSTGDADVMRVLLEFGANIRAPLLFDRGTVLDMAESICRSENADEQLKSELISLVHDFVGIEFPREGKRRRRRRSKKKS